MSEKFSSESLNNLINGAYSALIHQSSSLGPSVSSSGPLSDESLAAALEQLRAVSAEVSGVRSNNNRLVLLCERAVSQYEAAIVERDHWHRIALSHRGKAVGNVTI